MRSQGRLRRARRVLSERRHTGSSVILYGWTPGIGDPSLFGWLTVAAYGIAAWLCWRASRGGPRGERRLWLLFSAMLAFLCLNKQLDLQSLLTAAGRSLAKEQGWYEDRRRYQLAFIIAFAAGAVLGIAILVRRFASARWPVRGAMVGMILLILFVVIRASSFEKMDQFISGFVGGWRVNHVMEIGGIAIVALCAWLARRQSARRR